MAIPDLERMFSVKASKLGVRVDKVKHKAKITVDEVAAEAGAASFASVIYKMARLSQPISFTVDRPTLPVHHPPR